MRFQLRHWLGLLPQQVLLQPRQQPVLAPLLQHWHGSQQGPQQQALFSGVISSGDSQGVSLYVPLAQFRSSLARFLN